MFVLIPIKSYLITRNCAKPDGPEKMWMLFIVAPGFDTACGETMAQSEATCHGSDRATEKAYLFITEMLACSALMTIWAFGSDVPPT